MNFPIVIIWSPTATLTLTLVAVNVNLMWDLAEWSLLDHWNHVTVYHVKFKHLDKSEHFLGHCLDLSVSHSLCLAMIVMVVSWV